MSVGFELIRPNGLGSEPLVGRIEARRFAGGQQLGLKPVHALSHPTGLSLIQRANARQRLLGTRAFTSIAHRVNGTPRTRLLDVTLGPETRPFAGFREGERRDSNPRPPGPQPTRGGVARRKTAWECGSAYLRFGGFSSDWSLNWSLGPATPDPGTCRAVGGGPVRRRIAPRVRDVWVRTQRTRRRDLPPSRERAGGQRQRAGSKVAHHPPGDTTWRTQPTSSDRVRTIGTAGVDRERAPVARALGVHSAPPPVIDRRIHGSHRPRPARRIVRPDVPDQALPASASPRRRKDSSRQRMSRTHPT